MDLVDNHVGLEIIDEFLTNQTPDPKPLGNVHDLVDDPIEEVDETEELQPSQNLSPN